MYCFFLNDDFKRTLCCLLLWHILSHWHQPLSQMWQFTSDFQRHCRVFPIRNWGLARSFALVGGTAGCSKGYKVASVALCLWHTSILEQFSESGTDDVQTCNVLLSAGRLLLGRFWWVYSILYLFLIWGVVLPIFLYIRPLVCSFLSSYVKLLLIFCILPLSFASFFVEYCAF